MNNAHNTKFRHIFRQKTGQLKVQNTDKDHWIVMNYPFSPIPTDPAII